MAWPVMLAFFRLRAIAGIEKIGETTYTRSIRLGSTHGMLAVQHLEGTDALDARIHMADEFNSGEISLTEITMRLRSMFDLDADLTTIADHLKRDPYLAPLVAKRPAVRIAGHWEPFETAIRAVLGQQVSLVAARQLTARLVDRAGSLIDEASTDTPHRLFPTPQQVLAADLSNMGMPGARVRTMQAVAEAFIADPLLFKRGEQIDNTVARLSAIKGIGPWTAHYIAIRACREPDGFPASDAGLLRGMADEDGQRPTPQNLSARAEIWRPYRAYAAHHIWAEDEQKLPSGN